MSNGIKITVKTKGKPLFNPNAGGPQGRGFKYNGTQKHAVLTILKGKWDASKRKFEHGVLAKILKEKGVTYNTLRAWAADAGMEIAGRG